MQPCVPRGYGALPSLVIPDRRPMQRWLANVWWLLFFESCAEDPFPPGLRVVLGRKFPVGLPEIIYPMRHRRGELQRFLCYSAGNPVYDL